MILVTTGKSLKERIKGGKKTQLRGGRWNQLVLEKECVGEREN